jgi:hypothetical protein
MRYKENLLGEFFITPTLQTSFERDAVTTTPFGPIDSFVSYS